MHGLNKKLGLNLRFLIGARRQIPGSGIPRRILLFFHVKSSRGFPSSDRWLGPIDLS